MKLKQIEDEQNLNLFNLENTHRTNINKLEMKSKKIENKYKNFIKNEEISNIKTIKEMNNNIESMKRNSELEIMKINQNAELEEKKINDEIEINKMEINYRYKEKLRQEDLKKEIILRKQNLEKEKMEMKLELMMHQLMLNKINNFNN